MDLPAQRGMEVGQASSALVKMCYTRPATLCPVGRTSAHSIEPGGREELSEYVRRRSPVPQFGIWELLIVLVIVLMIFGATRIKDLGKGFGSAISAFRSEVKPDEEEGHEEKA